jgi:rhamnosyltransferase
MSLESADTQAVPRPEPSCIGAVVVTHHPDPDLQDRVRALRDQVAAILIVDNGSATNELEAVRRLVDDGLVQVIFNKENRGLAMALNQGLAWGEEQGLAWIVTLDQDTTPGSNLVAAAGRVFNAHRVRPVAAIGAGWVSRPDVIPDCSDPGGVEVACVITSGTLHSVPIWRALGGFRDDFFIDYVDTEFCLRARAAEYSVVRACLPTMTHAVGNPTRHWFLVRSFTPSNHTRMRRYFITRNRILVWKKYARTEPAYVWFDIRAAWKEFVKIVLVEDDRRGKLVAIARGIGDAFHRGLDS